ncbi:MAG TPA: type IV pilus secretin PilQ, partial [Lysobacter sp.]
LQTEGRGEVISNPRVVTSNQREAVITQGQEVGYVTIQPAQAGGVPTPSVQFKDVLLQMRVTPTITNDGRVFLNMAVKKDEVAGYVRVQDVGDVPQISKREVNTAVLVEDGQTVVIGGVYEFTERSDLTKVPFLADVPFLGNLFKKRGKTKDKAELLIFVTPKVLKVAQR